MNNPLNLNLDDPNVVVINGNVINSTAADNISRDASGSEYIYVNVNVDVLSKDQADQLSGIGLRILKYISKHTYLARYSNSDLDVIRQLPFVRSANVYGPALKTVGTIKLNLLGGNVGGVLNGAASNLNLKVVVLLHPDAPQSMQQVSQEISNRLGLNLPSLGSSLGGLELTVRPDQLLQIESIDSVSRIEEYLDAGGQNEYVRGILADNWDYSSVGISHEGFRWRGRGQVVCIADSGVDISHRAFSGKVHSQRNLWEPFKSMPKSVDYNGHGSHVAGSVVEGVAQESMIMVQGLTKDDNTGNFYSTSEMYQEAFDAGADVHTNSWGPKWPGYQVGYNISARKMDESVNKKTDQHKMIVVSAGNDGGAGMAEGKPTPWYNEIGGNNGAKNAICVGNGNSLRPNDGHWYDVSRPFQDPRSINRGSSCGPTLPEGGMLGRRKPDVIAPGTAVLSCKSPTITAENLEKYGWSHRNGEKDGYIFATGTSMATPHVAGCCAIIREALLSPLGGRFTISQPGGHLVKALLINGCVDLEGHFGGEGLPMGPAPSYWQGYGRVDLNNSLLHIERYAKKDPGTGFYDAGYNKPYAQPKPLYQGEWWYSELITCETKVFSVTLAYYDPPDEVSQNQLNLIVYNGEDYEVFMYGNCNERNKRQADQVNNVEKVVWKMKPGDSNKFRLCVWAQRIGRPNEPTGADQSYGIAWMSHE